MQLPSTHTSCNPAFMETGSLSFAALSSRSNSLTGTPSTVAFVAYLPHAGVRHTVSHLGDAHEAAGVSSHLRPPPQSCSVWLAKVGWEVQINVGDTVAAVWVSAQLCAKKTLASNAVARRETRMGERPPLIALAPTRQSLESRTNGANSVERVANFLTSLRTIDLDGSCMHASHAPRRRPPAAARAPGHLLDLVGSVLLPNWVHVP